LHGFDVARMNSYEVRGLRVSSSAVRDALNRGAMSEVAQLLGRPYAISGHVVHGRKLGRELNCRTLNLRFNHWKPAASGIFGVQVHGLGEHAGRYGHVAAALQAAGFAVRSYDQCGHGKSYGAPGSLPSDSRLLDDLADVIDATRAKMATNQKLGLILADPMRDRTPGL
jgi:hypothetical protein